MKRRQTTRGLSLGGQHGHAWHVDYIINTRLGHATRSFRDSRNRSPRRRHRLQCVFFANRPPPFLYTSLSTFRFPNLSIRRSLSFPPDPFLRDVPALSSSPFSSSSSESRFRLTPPRPAPPFPPPTLMFTRGGTAKPNAFPTLAKSSLFTSNIFLREYDAYA